MARRLLGRGRMLHLVARSVPGTLLWRTHAEARALFDLVAEGFPDAEAFCLMPDHTHIVGPRADRLRYVMSAYARWRNARRDQGGPVWQGAPAPEVIPDDQHLRRTVRYVHLNPCRAGLVADPLAWPWSTHRDAVGLAVPGVRRREHDPARFHRYVSGDPTVAVEGTLLPEGPWGGVRWEDVRDGVASVCRVPLDALLRRGQPRTLALRTAWALEAGDARVLGAATGLERTAVYRACVDVPSRGLVHREPKLHACIRAVGDDRFEPLCVGDLRRTPGWERYARLR